MPLFLLGVCNFCNYNSENGQSPLKVLYCESQVVFPGTTTFYKCHCSPLLEKKAYFLLPQHSLTWEGKLGSLFLLSFKLCLMGLFLLLILCICAVVYLLSHVQLFVTPWTIAHQAPLSVGFLRQKYWSGLPFTFPGDLPNPGYAYKGRWIWRKL